MSLKNMGTADRVSRVVLTALVVVLYFSQAISGTTAIILLAVAAVFILTSVISFCPLYYPFGIRTNKSTKA
ncbi:MAG: DUF2892 domain-containing protein [Cyclobacteriaceae bacterium]